MVPDNRRNTIAFMSAAQNLSIPELLQASSEKIGEECSRLREIPLPFALSAASLEPGVRYSCHTIMRLRNPDNEPLDQESRNPSARYPEAPTLSTEQIATSKQVASGDHFLHRPMRPPDRG